MSHVGLRVAREIVSLDVIGEIFEDVILDALRKAIPDDDVFQGLALKIRCAGRIDDANNVRVGCKVIDRLSDLFQFGIQRLP